MGRVMPDPRGIFRSHGAFVIAMLSVALTLGWASGASVITREQEIESRAQRIFEKGRKDLLQGRSEEALERFATVVKAYGRSKVAVEAQWEVVRLNEYFGDFTSAFDALQLLIDHYPGNFEKALRRQFDIALRQLVRYDHMERMPDSPRPKDLPKKDQVSAMLRIVIENGPYAENVAEASYYLGVALEKEGKIPQAAMHHEDFMERFPNHPLADDSAYQVAYILYKSWMRMKGGAPTNRDRAVMAMQWFLARYPESDKAAQARGCLEEIKHAERSELVTLAAYYEKQGNERASAVYYRDLASKFPELAPEGSALRVRVLALMEKYPEMKDERIEQPAPLGLPPLDQLGLPAELKASDIFEFEEN
jgi:outer membrane protein assembly factor BamD (BamD/ComL family)